VEHDRESHPELVDLVHANQAIVRRVSKVALSLVFPSLSVSTLADVVDGHYRIHRPRSLRRERRIWLVWSVALVLVLAAVLSMGAGTGPAVTGAHPATAGSAPHAPPGGLYGVQPAPSPRNWLGPGPCPPHTIIRLPSHTAVWLKRGEGALDAATGVQLLLRLL